MEVRQAEQMYAEKAEAAWARRPETADQAAPTDMPSSTATRSEIRPLPRKRLNVCSDRCIGTFLLHGSAGSDRLVSSRQGEEAGGNNGILQCITRYSSAAGFNVVIVHQAVAQGGNILPRLHH